MSQSSGATRAWYDELPRQEFISSWAGAVQTSKPQPAKVPGDGPSKPMRNRSRKWSASWPPAARQWHPPNPPGVRKRSVVQRSWRPQLSTSCAFTSDMSLHQRPATRCTDRLAGRTPPVVSGDLGDHHARANDA